MYLADPGGSSAADDQRADRRMAIRGHDWDGVRRLFHDAPDALRLAFPQGNLHLSATVEADRCRVQRPATIGILSFSALTMWTESPA